MDDKEKKQLSESDIKAKFITPAIIKAGWDEMTQIRREVTLTPGPVIVRGNMSSRNKKKKKFADYVLQREKGVPIAVVNAINPFAALKKANKSWCRNHTTMTVPAKSPVTTKPKPSTE